METSQQAVRNIPDSDPNAHREPGGDADHHSEHEREQEKYDFEKSIKKEIKREHGKTRKEQHK